MPTISSAFSISNAFVLAEACPNADSGESAIRAAHQTDKVVTHVKYYSEEDTQAPLLACKTCAVVSFRATEPPKLVPHGAERRVDAALPPKPRDVARVIP